MSEATGKRRIYIFDTTLRDGEQAPGCSMNHQEKLLVAEQLELLKVDIIEAGFAAASPGDFESVRAVAQLVRNAAVASLSRSLPQDIDASWQAVREARQPYIHTFLATSPLHMQYKLKMNPEQVYEQAVAMVRYARNLCPRVEFSLEDASRSERDFIYRVVEGVIAAGAEAVNIPDTVGYAMPDQFAALIRDIRNHVPNVDRARISVHCHNDLGLGVANSLAAILAGAGQVECTINGIGERAGNAAMEEIVMSMRTRPDVFADIACEVDTTRIYNASRCVVNVTGSRLQPNKAIVGENAFAHEAGIHQHGVMANARTYEIMTPESIGIPRNSMVLGKHSGRHAFETRLADLGFHFEPEKIKDLFAQFKLLADRKKKVSDADIEALARGIQRRADDIVKLDRFVVTSGNTITSTCMVRLLKDGHPVEGVAPGDGPISAAFTAINQILGIQLELEGFQLGAVTGGEDAQGEATVRVRHDGRLYNGHGLSTDVVEASIRAYLSAINTLLVETTETGGTAHETH
ncbi:MAG: 2-isopropylmalate synthase [Kiritimatiellae bacterium]|nr:2-isopropylmalate synthase [Kiritimatiellia bacterium]